MINSFIVSKYNLGDMTLDQKIEKFAFEALNGKYLQEKLELRTYCNDLFRRDENLSSNR